VETVKHPVGDLCWLGQTEHRRAQLRISGQASLLYALCPPAQGVNRRSDLTPSTQCYRTTRHERADALRSDAFASRTIASSSWVKAAIS
jgi:hypothetical protein